jgi:hypothetical protein
MFQELSPGGIWLHERRLWFSGVKLRSRMTVLRIDDKLWVHSASEPTPELTTELDRLGEVAWIVVPNRWHHRHAAAMKARYPAAQLVGPAAITKKSQPFSRDAALDEARFPELTTIPLRGVPFLDETVFFHTPTRTLIGADLMMCGCPADHWTWRWSSRVVGQWKRFGAPPDVRWKTKRGPEAQQSIDALAALPIERILVAHSDTIEDRPIEQLEDAWKFVRPRALRA